MKSVKGMMIGSPEFAAAVKAAKRKAEITELIADMQEDIDRIMRTGGKLTATQDYELRRVRNDINEVLSV